MNSGGGEKIYFCKMEEDKMSEEQNTLLLFTERLPKTENRKQKREKAFSVDSMV